MAAIDWSLGELFKLALTILGTAGASMYAARRAVAHELTKQRNARGFDRRAQWYEKARSELRQLSAFAHALMAAQHPLEPPPGMLPLAPSPLWSQLDDAEVRVHDLILDAAVYATPETVDRLNRLGRALDDLRDVLTPIAQAAESAHPRSTAEMNGTAQGVARVHAMIIQAFWHILDETRALHGFAPLRVETTPLPEALVNATLRAPRRLTLTGEKP